MRPSFRITGAAIAAVAYLILSGFNLENAIVPKSEILSGGPPKDGIPALLNPRFIPAEEADVDSDDLVVGVAVNGEARAYPVKILNWHEAVNDEIHQQPILVTY